MFDLMEPFGVQVTQNHCHEPVPDTRRLPEYRWARRTDLSGIDLHVEDQILTGWPSFLLSSSLWGRRVR